MHDICATYIFHREEIFAPNRAQFPAAFFPHNIIIFCDITINSRGDDYSNTGRIIIWGK